MKLTTFSILYDTDRVSDSIPGSYNSYSMASKALNSSKAPMMGKVVLCLFIGFTSTLRGLIAPGSSGSGVLSPLHLFLILLLYAPNSLLD